MAKITMVALFLLLAGVFIVYAVGTNEVAAENPPQTDKGITTILLIRRDTQDRQWNYNEIVVLDGGKWINNNVSSSVAADRWVTSATLLNEDSDTVVFLLWNQYTFHYRLDSNAYFEIATSMVFIQSLPFTEILKPL